MDALETAHAGQVGGCSGHLTRATGSVACLSSPPTHPPTESAPSLHVVYTPSTPSLHPVYTQSTRSLHPICTQSTPSPQPVYTPSTPRLHPANTQSTPSLHPVYTQSTPRLLSVYSLSTPWLHQVYTQSTPSLRIAGRFLQMQFNFNLGAGTSSSIAIEAQTQAKRFGPAHLMSSSAPTESASAPAELRSEPDPWADPNSDPNLAHLADLAERDRDLEKWERWGKRESCSNCKWIGTPNVPQRCPVCGFRNALFLWLYLV